MNIYDAIHINFDRRNYDVIAVLTMVTHPVHGAVLLHIHDNLIM